MIELIQQLVAATGVSEQQAEGGAGLLMGVLKDKLSEGDFASIRETLPAVDDLVASAPESGAAGGLGGLLGSAASAIGGDSIGDLTSLAAGFSKLGLDTGMIGQFVPIIVAFFQSQGGDELAGIIGKVLPGD